MVEASQTAVMPFGLVNTPTKFQELISDVLWFDQRERPARQAAVMPFGLLNTPTIFQSPKRLVKPFGKWRVDRVVPL